MDQETLNERDKFDACARAAHEVNRDEQALLGAVSGRDFSALAGLRAKLDGLDAEIERTRKDKREAQEALHRREQAWDTHIEFIRREREKVVAEIKDASQRARGVR